MDGEASHERDQRQRRADDRGGLPDSHRCSRLPRPRLQLRSAAAISDRRPHARQTRAPSRDIARSACDAVCHSSRFSLRHQQTPERAHDRVAGDPRLMRQEHDRERRAAAALVTRVARRPPRSRPATTCRAADGAAASRSETIHGAAIAPDRARSSGRRAGKKSHPAIRNASCAISTMLRRRLSKIFHRESSEAGSARAVRARHASSRARAAAASRRGSSGACAACR